jgi:DNA-directed RNA polymerase specialized sigma24 family protein
VNEDTGNEAPEVSAGRATISDRIAAFAMLDQTKDATQAQKCIRLSLVGFSASEIAGMLQTTVPTVTRTSGRAQETQALGKKSRTSGKRSKN